MIRTSACVIAGVLLPQLISFPSDSGWLISQFALLVIVLTARGWLKVRDVACALAGSAWFVVALVAALNGQLDRRFEGDSLLVDLEIADFPDRNAAGTRFVAVPLDDSRLPRRLRLRWFEPPVDLRYGDVWRLELRLKRPRGRLNPGGSDMLARHLANGTGATGYVVQGRHNRLLDSAAYGPIGRARVRFDARLANVVESPAAAAVLAAVGIGARHRLSAEQRKRYADTGTSHLMAISGLHVGLAAITAYSVARILLAIAGIGRRPHDAAILTGLAVAILYALLSGIAIPARRATLMLGFAGLALLLRRELSGLHVLAATALSVAVASPLATLSAAFRFSFAAVLLLLVAACQRPSAPGHWLLRPYIAGLRLASVQSLLFLGLLPLTALMFARVTIAGPLVNFVAIPVFGAVTVPLTLAGLALDGVFAPLGNLALECAALSVTWLEALIGLAAESAAARSVPQFLGLAWLCLLLPLCWLLPPGMPGRWVAWLGAVAVVLWRPPTPAEGCVRLDVLDVGQGLAVAVQTRRHALLYDAGPSYRGGGSTVGASIAPFLASRGVRSLDRLIVSHADNDHAGGVQDLLAVVPVARTLAGEVSVQAPRATGCAAEPPWQWDGVRFEFIHPPRNARFAGNNASCVLLISARRHRALLTGDIETQAEAMLVRRRALPGVDWALVPHHGSRTSSTLPFIRSLMPATAIVSAGYRNRWGMPAAEVVERWRGVGARVWNTAEAGAVSAELCDSGGRQAVGLRHSDARLWHRLEERSWMNPNR